jgi:hypothetical protein
MAKSKRVVLVIFVQERIKIKRPVKPANMPALKVPYRVWIVFQANTNQTPNKLNASIVTSAELLPMPLEKSIVIFAPKVDINRNRAWHRAWIVSQENINRNANSNIALSAKLTHSQINRLKQRVNRVHQANTLLLQKVPRVNHAAPVDLASVVWNAPVVGIEQLKIKI